MLHVVGKTSIGSTDNHFVFWTVLVIIARGSTTSRGGKFIQTTVTRGGDLIIINLAQKLT